MIRKEPTEISKKLMPVQSEEKALSRYGLRSPSSKFCVTLKIRQRPARIRADNLLNYNYFQNYM